MEILLVEKKKGIIDRISLFLYFEKVKIVTIDNKKDEKYLRKMIQANTNFLCRDEDLLLAFCLKHQRKIPVFADYPFIVKYHYEFVPGRSQDGEGDLLLKDENERYLVVEAKYIDHTKTGRNQGNKRTKKRRKVEKQVEENLLETRSAYPDKEVQGFVLTNETIPVELSEKFEEYRQQKELSWKK